MMPSRMFFCRDNQQIPCRGKGFTLLESLVGIGILTVLTAIVVPFILSARESSNRVTCAEHLAQINTALKIYTTSNRNSYPRVIYDAEHLPNGWTAFTGPDCDDPFLDNASVRPNDVTASLWLLVRLRLVSASTFICPSTADQSDMMLDAHGQKTDPERRGNFRGPTNLSYSYAEPFSNAIGYRWDDYQLGNFAVIADRNPGKAHGHNVEAVTENMPPLSLATGNSHNHRGAGQNVLDASGAVVFRTTPFCGAGRGPSSSGDNIYTALRRLPLEGAQPPANEPGYVSIEIGPAWANDSYLVPYEK